MRRSFYYFLWAPLLVFASWADDVLQEMSVEEKVGQLFMVPLCPTFEEGHFRDIERVFEGCHIGSVIVKQGSLADYERISPFIDALSPHLVLRAVDAEWGLGMRISDAPSFPKNSILGKYGSEVLCFEMGKCIAKEMRELHLHISFGPVLDVNSNPNNPIINVRSFGEDPDLVGCMGAAMVRGLQEGGIVACAKHFPGHGDVDVDSHLAMPVIRKTVEDLHKVELKPFQEAIKANVGMIMTAHLSFEGEVCPMSKRFITQLLREELGFNGIVISDALNMKGIANQFSPEEIALSYLQSGHDILLYGDHVAPNIVDILQNQVPRAFKAIVEEVKGGHLSIDDKVLRILKMKEKFKTL